MDYIDSVKWKKDVRGPLILEEEQKDIVHVLVASHQYPNDARNQTEQKGKGLVILLHGAPGSGKTMTAETAAEGTEKALLSVSLGDFHRTNR